MYAHATQVNPLSQQKQYMYIAYDARWLNVHSAKIVTNLLCGDAIGAQSSVGNGRQQYV